jgi:hypothetical protein
MSNPIAAASTAFAHLLGIPKAARAAEEDDKEKNDKDAAKAAAEDDADKKDDKDAHADESSDGDAEDGDDDDKKKSGKKSKAKKAKAKEDEDEDQEDDDSEKEMKGSSAEASARRRERARCAAIFFSTAAATRPDLAAHLAFETDLPRKSAVALLNAAASGATITQPRQSGLAARMAKTSVPAVGQDAPQATGAASTAQRMMVLYDQHIGRTAAR